MKYRNVLRHIKKANKNGLTIFFYPPTAEEESSTLFDVGSGEAGNGWKEFTPDMLTRSGCKMATSLLDKKRERLVKHEEDFCAMFYSLDETYQMPEKVVN